MSELVAPVVVAALVVVQVGLWQFRVSLAGRQRRRAAALLGSVDAVLYVGLLGQVLADLGRPTHVAGYAVGVGAGVYVGCLADARADRAPFEYRIVAGHRDDHVLPALRRRGWPVTASSGDGIGGGVSVLFVAVAAADANALEADLRDVAPGVFWTCNRLRSAAVVPLPAGFRTIGSR